MASDRAALPLQETLPASENAAGKPAKSKNRDLADMAEELKKKAKKGEVLSTGSPRLASHFYSMWPTHRVCQIRETASLYL